MPTVTRREFLKVGVAGAGTLAVSGLGFDVALAKSNRIKQQLRIEGAKELHSICPYCAVGCALVAYTRGRLPAESWGPLRQFWQCLETAGERAVSVGGGVEGRELESMSSRCAFIS